MRHGPIARPCQLLNGMARFNYSIGCAVDGSVSYACDGPGFQSSIASSAEAGVHIADRNSVEDSGLQWNLVGVKRFAVLLHFQCGSS